MVELARPTGASTGSSRLPALVCRHCHSCGTAIQGSMPVECKYPVTAKSTARCPVLLCVPLPLPPHWQEMDAFEAAVEEGEDIIDLTQTAHPKGPAAVARQMDRLMSFLTALTDVADDIVAQVEEAQKDQPQGEGQVSCVQAGSGHPVSVGKKLLANHHQREARLSCWCALAYAELDTVTTGFLGEASSCDTVGSPTTLPIAEGCSARGGPGSVPHCDCMMRVLLMHRPTG